MDYPMWSLRAENWVAFNTRGWRDGWTTMRVVPINGSGRYSLEWNGERFARNQESGRLAKNHPSALGELSDLMTGSIVAPMCESSKTGE